jgi:cysteine desulfurase
VDAVTFIYLDHNATTPLAPEAAEAIARVERESWANPASQHQPGRQARRVLESAREELAALLGADVSTTRGDRLVFTSGGTEANNLALFGLCQATGDVQRLVALSPFEHPSVLGVGERLAAMGWEVGWLRGLPTGEVDGDSLAPLLVPGTAAVSVMLGNNETGVLQPVGELARRATEAGVPFHTDAVQVVGKLPVDFHSLGVTTLAFSAHKFHGPRGIGGLLVRAGTRLAPLLAGGFQQAGLRPGTEPVALVVGMLVALRTWHSESGKRAARLGQLRDDLAARVQAAIPRTVVVGEDAPRLPHTLCLAFPGVDRRAMAMALDLAGVACSTGSACASGSSEPSHVLLAMGLSDEVVGSAIRFSLGAPTTAQEVAQAAERILSVYKHLSQRKDR